MYQPLSPIICADRRRIGKSGNCKWPSSWDPCFRSQMMMGLVLALTTLMSDCRLNIMYDDKLWQPSYPGAKEDGIRAKSLNMRLNNNARFLYHRSLSTDKPTYRSTCMCVRARRCTHAAGVSAVVIIKKRRVQSFARAFRTDDFGGAAFLPPAILSQPYAQLARL
jgi:hypothetical protein